MSDWNTKIIEEFRSNQGRVGGPFEGRPLLLLHHRGAKTGTERVSPLAYQALEDGSVAIFGSKGGSPTHPDWYHNLLANPRARVEVGTDSWEVDARLAEGEERERIWRRQIQEMPAFGQYEERTEGIREIPVFVLERAG